MHMFVGSRYLSMLSCSEHLQVLQAAHFFDPSFLEFRLTNFHKIDIFQSQGGGVDICSFDEDEAGGPPKTTIGKMLNDH